jgi:hypothetical protein
VRYPNSTKPSGSGIEGIISLRLGLAIAQQLVLAQYNIRAVSSTFGQRDTISDQRALILAQNAKKIHVAGGATAFRAS